MRIGIITKEQLPDYRYFKKIMRLYATNKDVLVYAVDNHLVERFVDEFPAFTIEVGSAVEIREDSDMVLNFTEEYRGSTIPVVFV